MVTETLLFSVLLLMYGMHNVYMHKHKKSTLYTKDYTHAGYRDKDQEQDKNSTPVLLSVGLYSPSTQKYTKPLI